MKSPDKKKLATLLKLAFAFILSFAFLFTLTFTAIGFLVFQVYKSPLFHANYVPNHFHLYILALLCIIIGSTLTAIFVSYILRPLRELHQALNKIENGDYTVRLKPCGILRSTRLYKKFNMMAQHLAGTETLQKEFINNFSHEFKTPISSMKGFAGLLKNDELTRQQRDDYIDIIISESQRLSDLASTVLMLSRVEQQSILSDIHSFNISEHIRRVVALFSEKLSEKKLNVAFNGNDCTLKGNPYMLEQVWINLIDNAIKFSPEGSSIDICLVEAPDRVYITVTDSGPGISEEQQSRIFDRFYQGDLSHKTSGFGLGLALVKKIVELHKGTVELKSSDESGTAFEVMLRKQP